VMRARLSRETVVSGLISRLGDATLPRGELRETLAEAIGDPSLELAYWVPDVAAYVDARGRPVEIPEEVSGRAWSPVEREGQPLAAIVYDAGLLEQRELIRAAGAAASIALENERLDAELRARLEDLRASRARIVAAGDEERRRLERDLHDGAQQRLVSLALTLRLARKRLGGDSEGAGELIDEAMAELEDATNELRELARGIHPAVLSDRGLAAAVRALAGRAPLPVEVTVADEERMPAPVESAAYFVVAEALTNVARYAEAGSVQVDVERSNGRVTIEVRDDGVGGADPAAGSALRGLADRVAAVDGSLSVESPPGRGTTVRAEFPCER
jgi:signal transduction histidine kinase